MTLPPDTSIETSHKGEVSSASIEIAVEKVSAVLTHCREPVRHVEIRLGLELNPRQARPAVAEVTVDVDGRPVRAHVSAPTIDEATDFVVDRLRRRLDEFEDRLHRLPRRHQTGQAEPGTWRHGDLPSSRSDYLDLPFDEREVRRRKTFALHPMTVDEAAFDLDALDHDFYLFVDEVSDSDALIRRTDDALELQCAAERPPTELVPDGMTTVSFPVPVLTLPEAKEHLEASGESHLFFVDNESRRGNVLYRRYDGHYGLVMPT